LLPDWSYAYLIVLDINDDDIGEDERYDIDGCGEASFAGVADVESIEEEESIDYGDGGHNHRSLSEKKLALCLQCVLRGGNVCQGVIFFLRESIIYLRHGELLRHEGNGAL
jgi:hypothetical protein